MTIAATDWLSISISLLLVMFVLVCALMIPIILMQRPKQEGLGAAFGAGVTDQVFGAQTTNVLQRGTVYLGSLFFILSLVLAVLIGHQNDKVSLLKKESAATKSEQVKPTESPVAPKTLSEQLPVEVKTPETPPIPAPAVAPTPPAAPAPQAEGATSPPAQVSETPAAPVPQEVPAAPAPQDKPAQP